MRRDKQGLKPDSTLEELLVMQCASAAIYVKQCIQTSNNDPAVFSRLGKAQPPVSYSN